jgi:hypothetical protein
MKHGYSSVHTSYFGHYKLRLEREDITHSYHRNNQKKSLFDDLPSAFSHTICLSEILSCCDRSFVCLFSRRNTSFIYKPFY